MAELQPADPPRVQRRGRRLRIGLLRVVAFSVLVAWCAQGLWHLRKELPEGLSVTGPPRVLPAGAVRLLADTTTADAFGRPLREQQIFDETLRLIGEARRFIVLDQFLFNPYDGDGADGGDGDRGNGGTDEGNDDGDGDAAGASPGASDGIAAAPSLRAAQGTAAAAPYRALSRELTEALLRARRDHPALRVLLITDPINEGYGADPSEQLAALRHAGVEVVVTELDRLRDSNPLYSGLWRLAIRWWSDEPAAPGEGWLPHPLDPDRGRVGLRAWARLLNFKANHRKVLIADDGRGEIVGIVSSANPHDASSAHSNLALLVRGEVLRALFESEIRIARFSGWRGVPILMPASSAATPAPAAPEAPAARRRGADARAPSGDPRTLPVETRVLTEGAIESAVLARIAQAASGERIQGALFYLSDRDVIEALIDASRRGVDVRLILDPNRDAFGRAKNGIPNRPVASELVARSDGAIKVRWYRTHGEQFHVKALAVIGAERAWLTLGSANLTRRNIDDFNLEANLAIMGARAASPLADYERWFDRLWYNRAPAGVEFTADFGSYADPSQSRYWAYRIMEATGLSTF